MWNPQYYDLANYLNEFVCDNSYPKGTGIAYYMDNWPSDSEIEQLVRSYFQLSQPATAQVEWNIEESQCRQALEQTKQCMVLNNYYWAVWAIMMLSEQDESDPSVFNWEFARGRALVHKNSVQDWQIG